MKKNQVQVIQIMPDSVELICFGMFNTNRLEYNFTPSLNRRATVHCKDFSFWQQISIGNVT